MMLYFRPHHFLCALGFQGHGYSPAFTKNFAAIVHQLCGPDGDSTEIIVTQAADHICQPCPHRRGQGCHQQAKITALDHAHADALQVKAGDQLTWGEAKKRIVQHISPEVFEDICKPCAWKALGVCREALQALHQNHGAWLRRCLLLDDTASSDTTPRDTIPQTATTLQTASYTAYTAPCTE
jgi:hypothetical protein